MSARALPMPTSDAGYTTAGEIPTVITPDQVSLLREESIYVVSGWPYTPPEGRRASHLRATTAGTGRGNYFQQSALVAVFAPAWSIVNEAQRVSCAWPPCAVAVAVNAVASPASIAIA
jgi:hypothetical protein